MGPIGRKIFGMSKENYVQKYGAKVYRYKIPVASGDYYNLNVEFHDKAAELTKIAHDKKIFESKLGELFKKQQLTGQNVSNVSNISTMNKFIKTSTASSGFEKYPKLLEMMEQNHQMKMTALRKQIEKLKADKSLTQEKPSTHASHNDNVNAHQNSNRINMESRQPVVYPNGHHFLCEEEMWV